MNIEMEMEILAGNPGETKSGREGEMV